MQFELTHLIDALPGLAWTALPDGRAELPNRRWLDYTGLTAEQAADRGWIEAIHPDVNSEVFAKHKPLDKCLPDAELHEASLWTCHAGPCVPA